MTIESEGTRRIETSMHLPKVPRTSSGATIVTLTLRRGWAVARDPLRRSRFRWFLLGWIITIPTLMLGGAFAVLGQHVVVAKGAFAIYGRFFPGNLHTHGVIMLTLGVLLCYGLSVTMSGIKPPRVWLRRVLVITGGYYAWSAMMLACAPLVEGGSFSFVGLIMWLAFAALPFVLLVGPPPAQASRRESELIRAAITVGVAPEQAKRLAHRFLHDGDANVT